MRARNLKPSIFKNELLAVADPLYTLVFEGLWCLADREGRLEDRPAITRHFPSARFATIAGAGHWVHAEAPDEFVGVLGRFVQG